MNGTTPTAARPAVRTVAGRWMAARRSMAAPATRVLAVSAMLLALSVPAWAEVSRDQAATAAQRQTGGRVLSVDKAETGQRTVWRVKVVTPRGEVRVVFIDADTAGGGRSARGGRGG